MVFTIEVYKEGNEFVAKCKELNIYSFGSSSTQAIERLKQIISFYIQEVLNLDNKTQEGKENKNSVEIH